MSDPKAQLQCLIRRQWVAATPEEQVRQSLLIHMVEQLGYPRSRLAVELPLKQLPHLANQGGFVPNRRADILCYAEGLHQDYPLYPLLLVECKAIPLTTAMQRQVVGYNRTVAAPFVCLANASEILVGWFDPAQQKYSFASGLAPYSHLKGMVVKG